MFDSTRRKYGYHPHDPEWGWYDKQCYSPSHWIVCPWQEQSSETIFPFAASGFFSFHRNCTSQNQVWFCQWLGDSTIHQAANTASQLQLALFQWNRKMSIGYELYTGSQNALQRPFWPPAACWIVM